MLETAVLQPVSIVQVRLFPQILLFSTALFLVDTTLFGSAAGSSRDAPFARDSHVQQQLAEFFQAIRDVLGLIPIPLAMEHQVSLVIDPLRVPGHRSVAHIVWQTGRRSDRPVKGYFGIDLIDVLAARSTAARVGPVEFGERNLDSRMDSQHGLLVSRGIGNSVIDILGCQAAERNHQRPNRSTIRVDAGDLFFGHGYRRLLGDELDLEAMRTGGQTSDSDFVLSLFAGP